MKKTHKKKVHKISKQASQQMSDHTNKHFLHEVQIIPYYNPNIGILTYLYLIFGSWITTS